MAARPPNNNWIRDEEPPNNHHNISPVVQEHLMKVYFLLCCASLVTATGSCLPLLWNPGALITTLAAVGSIVGLVKTPLTEQKVRIALLMIAAIFLGASIRLLFDLVTPVETSFLVRGIVGVAIGSACFSAAATRATRPVYLYRAGFVLSIILIRIWLVIASIIFGGLDTFMNFKLHTWEMLFVFYIVLGTPEVIQKADSGDLDYVLHCCELLGSASVNFDKAMVCACLLAAAINRFIGYYPSYVSVLLYGLSTLCSWWWTNTHVLHVSLFFVMVEIYPYVSVGIVLFHVTAALYHFLPVFLNYLIRERYKEQQIGAVLWIYGVIVE